METTIQRLAASIVGKLKASPLTKAQLYKGMPHPDGTVRCAVAHLHKLGMIERYRAGELVGQKQPWDAIALSGTGYKLAAAKNCNQIVADRVREVDQARRRTKKAPRVAQPVATATSVVNEMETLLAAIPSDRPVKLIHPVFGMIEIGGAA